MKKLITIFLLLFSVTVSAQNTLLTGDTLTKSKRPVYKQPFNLGKIQFVDSNARASIQMGSVVDEVILKIANIGDMGTNNTDQRRVATLINILNPDIITTNGDNIYGVTSHGNTYDSVNKKYYGKWHTKNIATNKFFPAIGNHDLDEFPAGSYGEFRWYYSGTYSEYFSGLPNNRRYYSKLTKEIKPGSSIKLISFNSDFGGAQTYCAQWNRVWEPSGIDSTSIQANWLRGEIITSKEKFNILNMHYPAKFSWGSLFYTFPVNCFGNIDTIRMRIDTLFNDINWVINEKNVSLITAGHNHLFESIGSKLVINGLGGGAKDATNPATVFRTPGSNFLFNSQFGAGLLNEYRDSVQYLFITIDNDTVWRQAVYPLKSVRVKAYFEGYNYREDTLKVFLKSTDTFHPTIDSSAKVLNQKGEAVFWFPNATYGQQYYLALKHRGSIETWSSQTITIKDTLQYYNFTDNPNKTAGRNVLTINGVSYIYSGDANQDGVVDASDMSLVENDMRKFSTGYLGTDFNGDGFVDATDMSILDNNLRKYLTKIMP